MAKGTFYKISTHLKVEHRVVFYIYSVAYHPKTSILYLEKTHLPDFLLLKTKIHIKVNAMILVFSNSQFTIRPFNLLDCRLWYIFASAFQT